MAPDISFILVGQISRFVAGHTSLIGLIPHLWHRLVVIIYYTPHRIPIRSPLKPNYIEDCLLLKSPMVGYLTLS